MIDSLDLKIINILHENSRLTFATIGRKIGLSPSAVRERIQKLEDKTIIEGYSLKVNNRLLGKDIEAFISVKAFHGKLKSLILALPHFPEVKKAYRITGGQNVHLEVVMKDRLELQNLIDQLMEYGDTLTQIILSEIKL